MACPSSTLSPPARTPPAPPGTYTASSRPACSGTATPARGTETPPPRRPRAGPHGSRRPAGRPHRAAPGEDRQRDRQLLPQVEVEVATTASRAATSGPRAANAATGAQVRSCSSGRLPFPSAVSSAATAARSRADAAAHTSNSLGQHQPNQGTRQRDFWLRARLLPSRVESWREASRRTSSAAPRRSRRALRRRLATAPSPMLGSSG